MGLPSNFPGKGLLKTQSTVYEIFKGCAIARDYHYSQVLNCLTVFAIASIGLQKK